jgi:hypothetical protein
MADTGFSSVEIDPATGLPKKKNPMNQPYLNENGTGYLPVSPLPQTAVGGGAPQMPNLPAPVAQPQTPSNPTVQQVEQGSLNTIATAQNTAQNSVQKSPLQLRADEMVREQMLNPNFGYDPASYNANALSNYDLQKAQAAKAFQQKQGDFGGSGLVQQNLLQTILSNTSDRSNLEIQLNQQQYETLKKNWADAISAGNTQTKSDSDVLNAGVNSLVNVAGAGEGTATRTAQQQVLDKTYSQDVQKMAIANGYDLAKLDKTFGQQMATLMATQDFEGAQNQLNRNTQVAMQSNDINQRTAALQKQLDYSKWAQENGQQFTAEQNAMNRTLEVSLKNLDLQGQTDLLNLKSQIDAKAVLNANSFTSAEAALDRAAAVAAQQGNIQAQKDVLTQKAALDLLAQQAQNEFTATLTKSTQTWQTGERISQDDFAKQTQAIDLAAKDAAQNKDIDAQKALETMKGNVQLQMQTQDMNQQEKMAYLNSQLADAKANNDVGRQMQIIGFQTTQDITKLMAAGEIDKAKAYIQQQYAVALQDNDAAHIQALELTKEQFTAKEDDENRALEQQKIDLQKAGVDMEKMDQTYTYLQGEVDAGRADPSVLTAFVQGVASKAGVTLTKPDPQAAQKAAQKKYNDMLGQFALTHPEYVTYIVPTTMKLPNGRTINAGTVLDPKSTSTDAAEVIKQLGAGNLTPVVTQDGTKAFNEFFNSATYGELTPEEEATRANAGYLTAEDLPSAVGGDKFNLDEPTTFTDPTGKSINIPAGKYTVKETTTSEGTKFFGTYKETTHEMLVDASGKEVGEISRNKGGGQGNIVSNLWAQ